VNAAILRGYRALIPNKRGKTMPWKTFLKAHFGAIAVTDFFTVEVLTFTGLVRYVVLFVIDLESRRVHIAGVVRQPHGAWIQQVAKIDSWHRTGSPLHPPDSSFTSS
jgi:putative transposase